MLVALAHEGTAFWLTGGGRDSDFRQLSIVHWTARKFENKIGLVKLEHPQLDENRPRKNSAFSPLTSTSDSQTTSS